MEFVILVVENKDSGTKRTSNRSFVYSCYAELIAADQETQEALGKDAFKTFIPVINMQKSENPSVNNMYGQLQAQKAIADACFHGHWVLKGKINRIVYTFQPKWDVGEGEEVEEKKL